MLRVELQEKNSNHFLPLNRTPGHPERIDTEGIEVTTGPLGQGVSNAVGMAAAEAHFAATFNKPGYEIFNNYIYTILGDGCLQEGVASEACSLAGHLQLGKLIAIYDDNHITIDGDTDVSFTEDVIKRFESYGWHTQVINNGDTDIEDFKKAIIEAKKVTNKPSLIKVRTTIGKCHCLCKKKEDMLSFFFRLWIFEPRPRKSSWCSSYW